MTDKELLELIATKVLRHKLITWQHGKFVCQIPGDKKTFHWNPLEDDGDAFRLAVDLNIDIINAFGTSTAVNQETSGYVAGGADNYAATRRAIVLTATEIAKSC